jgi:twitching motility protein PilT
MPAIDELLVYLKDNGGSDLHLSSGREPRIRKRGSLESVAGQPVLDDHATRDLLQGIANQAQWQQFETRHDLDFAYGLPGVARFRANYFVQEGGAGAVFRIIPEKIVPLEDLQLPPSVERLGELEKGLVLVTGPTGSGKSTTLAAIIDLINRKQARHIVTLEDPVEFVHQNKTSVISHREIGTHAATFADGLRAAIRQDADVVLVGEMRDRETISLALTAAEMGLLVFGTLHTNSAAKTIDRIVDMFPSEQQNQVRLTLSESIAAIIAQLLLPTADGKGRRAVVEILLRTSALPNLIRENNLTMLLSLMQSGRKEGMQIMDDALMELVQNGSVTPRDAYMKATQKARFEALLPKEQLS